MSKWSKSHRGPLARETRKQNAKEKEEREREERVRHVIENVVPKGKKALEDVERSREITAMKNTKLMLQKIRERRKNSQDL